MTPGDGTPPAAEKAAAANAAGEKEDGRRVRGERRRAAIIAATLRVVERDGVAGVTHRAVAAEAEIPASSAVYYFATIDDLLVAALTDAADAYVRHTREAVDGGKDALEAVSEAVVHDGTEGGRKRALAEYELTLLAVRRPSLRPVARRWMDMVTEIARRYSSDPVAVRTAVAATDGLCLEALLTDRDLDAGEAEAVLRHALRLP